MDGGFAVRPTTTQRSRAQPWAKPSLVFPVANCWLPENSVQKAGPNPTVEKDMTPSKCLLLTNSNSGQRGRAMRPWRNACALADLALPVFRLTSVNSESAWAPVNNNANWLQRPATATCHAGGGVAVWDFFMVILGIDVVAVRDWFAAEAVIGATTANGS